MNTDDQTYEWNGRRLALLSGLLIIWFAAAYAIGAGHLLVNTQSSFFFPIAITAIVPVALFLALYGLSTRFRTFVLSQDIQMLTMVQHWRVIGFVFLALYAFGILPGLFAWPAGLGDVALGIAALFVVQRMRRDADFVLTRGYLRFHLLGLLDFAVAIFTAALATGAFPELVAGGVTSAPMDVWPLNIFPSFLVPAFIILQLTAILKVRHLHRAASGVAGTVLGTAPSPTR